MKRLLYIFALLLSFGVQAQTIKPLGSVNAADTNKIPGALQVVGKVRYPSLATGRTMQVFIRGNGDVFVKDTTTGGGGGGTTYYPGQCIRISNDSLIVDTACISAYFVRKGFTLNVNGASGTFEGNGLSLTVGYVAYAGSADNLNGQPPSYYLNRANHSGTQAISTVTNLQSTLDSKANKTYNDSIVAKQHTDSLLAEQKRKSDSTIFANGKLNVTDTAAMLLPYKTMFSRDSVTEYLSFYKPDDRQDSVRIDPTQSGKIIAENSVNMSTYLQVRPNDTLIMYTADSSLVNMYGWTYDNTLTGIGEIRPAAQFSTQINTWSFVTPANVAYLVVYIKANNKDFSSVINIVSKNTVTYKKGHDPDYFTGSNDVIKLNNALLFAKWTSDRVVRNTKSRLLDSCIIIPSHVTLQNTATIKLKRVHDNILRNWSIGRPPYIVPTADRDISIVGLGAGIFQGNDNSGNDDNPVLGDTNLYKYTMSLYLGNITNYSVIGNIIMNSNAWGCNNEQARWGLFRDNIILQNGNHLNQDGINIREGCHDILIDGLRGVTQDDFVALTNINGRSKEYTALKDVIYERNGTLNTYNIKIKNIHRNVADTFSGFSNPRIYKGGILLLNTSGRKLWNVEIENVTGLPQLNVGYDSTTFAGQYGSLPLLGDTYNIRVSNFDGVVRLYERLLNCSFINIPYQGVYGEISCVPLSGSHHIKRSYNEGSLEEFTYPVP